MRLFMFTMMIFVLIYGLLYCLAWSEEQGTRYEITVKCISLKDGSIQLDKAYVGRYEVNAKAYQFLVKDNLGRTTEKIEIDAKFNNCIINEKLKSSASSN